MLICNLFETIHNIWLQQFNNSGTCFFIATFHNYVQTFKQSSLYYAFLQGGAFGTGLGKNELCLRRVSKFGDLVEITTTIIKYTLSFSLFTKIPQLEGEKVFGSTKCKADLPHGSKKNSHQYDWVNFSCLKVANAMAPIN